ncbi:sodium/hydrogen antiporter [Nematocida major]|uniref:sodium/hydrogen antiporter n=1 Tax=Nematocida major TaxID=1912982 RepID=UPI0020072B99|nr:sodium/hydrogen antiporter [Nematocida major]KAH9386831.1 sodium/hydrogen antiporter [Nematocida major]
MKSFASCCTVLGGFILSFGLLSLFIKEKLYIAETTVATLYGIICRYVLEQKGDTELLENLQNPQFLFHFSHIVLSLQLVAVGVTVPRIFIKKNWRPLAVLLLPVMLIMYAFSSIIVKYALDLEWLPAMIIGACITPTDPVLASAVIKGKFANKYIPSRLRYLLAVESGANDGLGFPLLVLPILLMKSAKRSDQIAYTAKKWIFETWGFEILFAIVLGAGIGAAARILLKYSVKKMLIDKESFLAYSLALAILVTGVTAFIQSDDLLAVFASGLVFSWDEEMVRDMKNSHVMEVVDLIFNQSFFIVLGLILPLDAFSLRMMAGAVLILLFRRVPALLLMKKFGLFPGLSTREILFAGWFGPIGVGAIFFAHHAAHELDGTAHAETILKTVQGIVFSSILVHGTTAPIIHMHLRRKHRKTRKTLESMYESDTEVEREADMQNLQEIIG